MTDEHDFAPLGTDRIFCRHCGEFREAPATWWWRPSPDITACAPPPLPYIVTNTAPYPVGSLMPGTFAIRVQDSSRKPDVSA